MEKKIPVIIDCDPGLDDVVALLLACADERLDIKAVTVVAGNQTLDKVGNNALRVLSFAGANLPVAYGCDAPLVRELRTAGEVHGEDGLHGIHLPEASLEKSEYHAVELMEKIIRESEEKITLIPLGPLTNIALLLLRHPELKSKIEAISLMGGAISGGNTTAAAEFNILVDPEAADIVFKSGLPITMLGLDVTHKAIVTRADIERIKSVGNEIGEFMGEALGKLANFHKADGIDGCYLHDPVAVINVLDPEIIKTIPLKVDIELRGEHTTGSTVANLAKRFNMKPNANVGIDIDKEKFIDLLLGTVEKYSKEG